MLSWPVVARDLAQAQALCPVGREPQFTRDKGGRIGFAYLFKTLCDGQQRRLLNHTSMAESPVRDGLSDAIRSVSGEELRAPAERLDCHEPAHLDIDGHHLAANMDHEHLHAVTEPKLIPKQAKRSIFGALFSRTLPQCKHLCSHNAPASP